MKRKLTIKCLIWILVRLQTLEKSYEVAKQRLKESEDDRARLG